MDISAGLKCWILATIWSQVQFIVLASEIYLTEFAAGTNNMNSSGVILDTTQDICYVGQSHEAQLTVQLPISTLAICFANLSKIVIKTRSGLVVSVGQYIISDQDRGRWTLQFFFEHGKNSYGTLTLILYIDNVLYRDSRNLYLEIRDEDKTYKTKVQEWNYVPDKSEATDQGTNINDGKDGPLKTHETDTDHEREVSTEENTSSEDRSAIQQAKVRALENELMVMQNKLIDFQAKEIHHLEAKNNSSQTVKNLDGMPGPNALDITSFCIGVFGALTVTVLLLVFFMKYGINVSTIDGACEPESWQTLSPGITIFKHQHPALQETENLV